MKERIELTDEMLNDVNGGLFSWNPKAGIMTYTHEDGSVTKHEIKDFDNAWYWSNQFHSEGMDEDSILAKLQQNNFIK